MGGHISDDSSEGCCSDKTSLKAYRSSKLVLVEDLARIYVFFGSLIADIRKHLPD